MKIKRAGIITKPGSNSFDLARHRLPKILESKPFGRNYVIIKHICVSSKELTAMEIMHAAIAMAIVPNTRRYYHVVQSKPEFCI